MNNNIMGAQVVIDKALSLGCNVVKEAQLKNYTSFRVGGKCIAVININSQESATDLFAVCCKLNLPYLVLGRGSDMLIDDKGFNGIVFVVSKDFSKINLINENTIECEAGCAIATVSYFAYKHGLSGLEFAWGIPGTAGGAVVMNAGAYGGEISDVISYTQQVSSDGELSTFNKEQLCLSYRHSVFTDNQYMITKVVFSLKRDDKASIKARMDDYLLRRKTKQPLEFASAGSTFKRPVGAYAGKLIEDSGLRGYAVGDAQVSEKHCGFVVNKGNASFDDIMQVINIVQKVVKEKSGFNLECEVKIIMADK